MAAASSFTACKKAPAPASDKRPVGRIEGPASIVPVGQTVAPAGHQVPLPGMRPQAMALSLDESFLAVSGKTRELVILDAATGSVRQRVPLPSEAARGTESAEPASGNILEPDVKGQISYTGLVFSPDGLAIYLSNVNGSIKVFSVGRGGLVSPSHSIPLPAAAAPRRKAEIPSGLALSPDGLKLYVCANLSNRLLEIDPRTAKVLRSFETGVAPFDVVMAGGKAYVSNWGGRLPRKGDITGPAGRGTVVRVDGTTRIASEGSVSVFDLASGLPVKEIVVHRHSSALALSPDGRWLVCANAADDNLSIIDTRTDAVKSTAWVKRSPADIFGASPNALCFSSDGKTLYAANGTQNAIAVLRFDRRRGRAELKGLIPAGWFPGALAFRRAGRTIIAANIKGLPAEKQVDEGTGAPGFNSYQYSGSISIIPIPAKKELRRMTGLVYAGYHRESIREAIRKPRRREKPRPVPERIGEPSVFKHVVYIIKENRTYDQVLGDIGFGNSDSSLCIFGEEATPNQHKMAREFVLLDNIYCSGILSADGHQWSTTAFGTDYLERSFAGWPRSYPDGMGPDEIDALAYAPTGFIWDNAIKHGLRMYNFGEFMMSECRWADPSRKGAPRWKDYWDEYLNKRGEVLIGSRPGIETIAPFSPGDTVGWDLDVPDAWRADFIIKKIREWENAGLMPQLILICLPNDHTSGTKWGSPVPEAQAADNDLAFGRIVEALSHSVFWNDTVLFAIEDDPQNGFDHVSGYRTTAYCLSPYTKRKAVVTTRYNTTSILRTMEQILGLPPMNQFDATAVPMFDCFTETPDLTPYDAVPNRIPLDRMNLEPKAIADALLRKNARLSARLNFRMIDACPEDTLNRILWHSVKGGGTAYPEWAVTLVDEDGDDD